MRPGSDVARIVMVLAIVAACLCASPPAAAQAAASNEDRCPAAVARLSPPGPRVLPAFLRPASLVKGEIRLTFVGHSTFLIETPGGISAATDYNDYIRPAVVPTVATMNRAHDTHYSNFPDPRIRHVLRGWDPEGGIARHDIKVGDMRVRNLPTNIRGFGGTESHGNSIFIFEAADLCVAHLGHLHHTLGPSHLMQLGQIDVVLVPIDGSFTLDLEGMVEVLTALKAPLMVPMHYFGEYTLTRFLQRVANQWEVERSAVPTMTVSRKTLPPAPKVVVLPGR